MNPHALPWSRGSTTVLLDAFDYLEECDWETWEQIVNEFTQHQQED